MTITNNFMLVGSIVAIVSIVLFAFKPKFWKIIFFAIGIFLIWLSKHVPNWLLEVLL